MEKLSRDEVIRKIKGKDPLKYVDLTGLDLSGLDLSGIPFGKVDFTGSNLSGADLSNANLSSAILKNADLSRVDLTGAKYESAKIDNTTFTDAIIPKKQIRWRAFRLIHFARGVFLLPIGIFFIVVDAMSTIYEDTPLYLGVSVGVDIPILRGLFAGALLTIAGLGFIVPQTIGAWQFYRYWNNIKKGD